MAMVTSSISAFYETESPSTEMGDSDVDFAGTIWVLIWEGLGNRIPKWKKCRGRISSGYLYVENSKNEILRWIRLDDGIEIRRIAEQWVFGKKHVLALTPHHIPLKKVAETAEALVFRLENTSLFLQWLEKLRAAQREILQLTQTDAHGNADHAQYPLTCANRCLTGYCQWRRWITEGRRYR